MRRMLGLALGMALGGSALDAQAPAAPDSSKSRFALGWNLYASPQIWPNVGDDEDHKFGIDAGGMIGIAWLWYDMAIVVGPHLSYQFWTADYSQKPMSATRSVTFGLADAGVETVLHFDKSTGFWFGAGSSTMDASWVADNGETFYYTELNGKQYSYLTAGMTFRVGQKWRLGFGVTQYEKAIRDANRVELRFGLGY